MAEQDNSLMARIRRLGGRVRRHFDVNLGEFEELPPIGEVAGEAGAGSASEGNGEVLEARVDGNGHGASPVQPASIRPPEYVLDLGRYAGLILGQNPDGTYVIVGAVTKPGTPVSTGVRITRRAFVFGAPLAALGWYVGNQWHPMSEFGRAADNAFEMVGIVGDALGGKRSTLEQKVLSLAPRDAGRRQIYDTFLKDYRASGDLEATSKKLEQQYDELQRSASEGLSQSPAGGIAQLPVIGPALDSLYKSRQGIQEGSQRALGRDAGNERYIRNFNAGLDLGRSIYAARKGMETELEKALERNDAATAGKIMQDYSTLTSMARDIGRDLQPENLKKLPDDYFGKVRSDFESKTKGAFDSYVQAGEASQGMNMRFWVPAAGAAVVVAGAIYGANIVNTFVGGPLEAAAKVADRAVSRRQVLGIEALERTLKRYRR